MSEETISSNKLEFFLNQQLTGKNSKFSTIQKVLRKVESDVNLSSKEKESGSKSLTSGDPIFQKALENSWSAHKGSLYQKKTSNLSTTTSNGKRGIFKYNILDGSSILDRLPEGDSVFIDLGASIGEHEEISQARGNEAFKINNLKERRSYTVNEKSPTKKLRLSFPSGFQYFI
jgi:hypothetical protein